MEIKDNGECISKDAFLKTCMYLSIKLVFLELWRQVGFKEIILLQNQHTATLVEDCILIPGEKLVKMLFLLKNCIQKLN